MSGMRKTQPQDELFGKLAASLQEAVALMRDAAYEPIAEQVDATEQDTLLQQCLSLCQQQESTPSDHLRVVHHFACTGGTLICKGLGLMPNVQLLSEVDPLSPLEFDPRHPKFAPTDLNRLIRQGTRPASDSVLAELFQAGIRVIHKHAQAAGQRLVLRDHSHSHFCTGPAIPKRPTLIGMLPPELPVLSVLTVRHPADSFAALAQNQWINFAPPNFAEYCRRYMMFIDSHHAATVFRYEDFTAQPIATMEALCDALRLPFNPEFEQLLDIVHLTGDSGRSSNNISNRPRREAAKALIRASENVPEYNLLVDRLAYSDDI